MRVKRREILLVDLPTYPKGVVPLSLAVVAATLRDQHNVEIVDLNFSHYQSVDMRALAAAKDLVGFKVSAQNLPYAIALSGRLKDLPKPPHIVWGGELPTLLPDVCLQHADSVVSGRMEPHAAAFLSDLERGSLKRHYHKQPYRDPEDAPAPALDLIPHKNRYYRFMGLPLETSLGCQYKCSFCLVHEMQGEQAERSSRHIAESILAHGQSFLNVIDYNIADNLSHLYRVTRMIERSRVVGWMGEMCIETLDNDEVLRHLRESRCRIVYCGLETIDNKSLRLINKRQNKIADYRRIIAKAQGYGIQIASGLIIGLEGTHERTLADALRFFTEVGVIYVKLTFLTFNPGTKVRESMRGQGTFLTDDPVLFDGNHLTFRPDDCVAPEQLYAGTREFVRKFYSLRCTLERSRHLNGEPLARMEFMLFSFLFGRVYADWRLGDQGGMKHLLEAPVRRSLPSRLAEWALQRIRRVRYRRSLAWLVAAACLCWTAMTQAAPLSKIQRVELLESCYRCHPTQHRSELAGPHGNTYGALLEYRHRVVADRNGVFSNQEHQKFAAGIPSVCTNCHIPENLFEDRALVDSTEAPVFRWDNVLPTSQKSESPHGIDCLTCHFSGGRVVGGKGAAVRAANAPESCHPVDSPALSSATFCYLCHEETARQAHATKARGHEIPSCLSCHQQTNESGKWTHYLYWRKTQSPVADGTPFQKLFERIQTSIVKTGTVRELVIEWNNDVVPHRLPECYEFTVVVEILDRAGKVCFETRVRLASNPGPRASKTEVRLELRPHEPGMSRRVALSPAVPAEGLIRIRVRTKPQYQMPNPEPGALYVRAVAFGD